jgi:ribosomal protein S12 methylthiotransferase accessory factor
MSHVFGTTAQFCPESALPRVISPKTGIVKSLGHLFRNPGAPSPHIVSSALTAFHRFSGNKADFAATGTSFNMSQAHWSAMGEAVERYCAALSDFQHLHVATYNDLTAAGHTALPPESFTVFDDDQFAAPDFPFARPEGTHKISWIAGTRLHDQSPVFVPAGLVFNQFRPKTGEKRLCPDIHPGVASGCLRERVLTSALLEIVERDTMMIHWLNRLPVTGIAQDDDFHTLRQECGIPPHLSLHLAFLQTDFAATCIFALLLDHRHGVLGGGCSAGFVGREVAQKAICEAIQILCLSREVQRGERGRLASKGKAIPAAFLNPTKRKNLPLTELLYNLGYYLETDNWSVLSDILSPPHTVRLKDCDQPRTGRRYTELSGSFEAAGIHPICVDLTTPDVADTGWIVFRIVAPGAVPNLPTLYPPRALKRLRTVPQKLGFPHASEWNTLPMPYA